MKCQGILYGIMPGVKKKYNEDRYYISGIMAHPTKEGINEIIKAIQESRVLGDDERKDAYGSLHNSEKLEHTGIIIKPDSIVIQDIRGGFQSYDGQGSYRTFDMEEKGLGLDINGMVVETGKESILGSDGKSKDYRETISKKVKSVFDKNGIEMEKDFTEYGYKRNENSNEFEQFVTYKTHSTRDSENPFIRKVETIQNEAYDKNNEYIPMAKGLTLGLPHYESRGTHYFPISPVAYQYLDILGGMYHVDVTNFKGTNEPAKVPVFFDTIDEAQKYYEEHTKEEIAKKIWRVNKSDRFYNGKKALAEKVGINIDENEK